MSDDLSVIMPVFNEANTLDAILGQALDQACIREILIVDDGSTDGSSEIIRTWAQREPRVTVLAHHHNQGKGAALITARKHVSG